MIRISEKYYFLEINAKTNSVKFYLGNLSDAGWFWDGEGEDTLLFLYRILTSKFRKEFINKYKEEASNNPQDHNFFMVELARNLKDKDALKELLYGVVGDNVFFINFNEAISSFLGETDNLDNFRNQMPDLFENKKIYNFVNYLFDKSILSVDISPHITIEKYFSQIDLENFSEVKSVAEEIYNIFDNILKSGVDVDAFYYTSMYDGNELGYRLTEDYIMDTCDFVLISPYGDFFDREPVDIFSLNFKDMYNFIEKYISLYPNDVELISVLVPFLAERKIKISLDNIKEICDSVGLNEQLKNKWISEFKQTAKKYRYNI